MSDWRKRLADIATWKAGWMDGDGAPLPPSGEEWSRTTLGPVFDDFPGVLLCLTEDGLLTAEWQFGHWRPSVEVDTVTHGAEFHTCYVGGSSREADESTELLEVDLSSDAGRGELARLLRRDMERAGPAAVHASDIPAVGQRARDAANTAALRLAAHREKE